MHCNRIYAVRYGLLKLKIIEVRMKDFFDLWIISDLFSFDGKILAGAIRATFNQRSTKIPKEVPTALSYRLTPPKTSKDGRYGKGFCIEVQFWGHFRSQKSRTVSNFILPTAKAAAVGEEFDLLSEAGKHWRAH